MRALIFIIFVVLFFVGKLILRGAGEVAKIATDAYNEVNDPKKQINTYFCPTCHMENSKDSSFCIYCGAKLQQYSNQREVETLASCAVTLIAYVAKADKIISQNEANIISELLNSISDNNMDFRSTLKNIYNNAKNTPLRDHRYFAQLMLSIAIKELSAFDQKHFFKTFLRWLVSLVYADGKKNQPQAIMTEEIAKYLNISQDYLNMLYDEFDDMIKKEKTNSCKSNKMTIEECYTILKCTPNSTNEEIKKSYRELVKQYHPDTVQGKGLAEDFILFANQKFKEINNAYEFIKKVRGIK
ncbi:MAG: DnaJ domain-containing protein [Campylobacterales bacterium]|nr:DnaJ domain-containing protein [Campylobacterales bacterium]